MAKISRLLDPLRRAAQAFFVNDVTLRREDGSLRVALEERRPPGQPRPPTAVEQAAERQRRELELMLGQLAEVLDELPETRATLRHLVFVEHALHKRGLRALQKMPLDVLRRGLEQFEGLVTNWSPVGLAALRSKMAVAVIEREHHDVTTEAGALDSVFAPERVEAVLMEPPRVQAERAIAEAKASAFADSTIEKLALEFGVAAPGAPRVQAEIQGELRSRDTGRRIEVRKLHA